MGFEELGTLSLAARSEPARAGPAPRRKLPSARRAEVPTSDGRGLAQIRPSFLRADRPLGKDENRSGPRFVETPDLSLAVGRRGHGA